MRFLYSGQLRISLIYHLQCMAVLGAQRLKLLLQLKNLQERQPRLKLGVRGCDTLGLCTTELLVSTKLIEPRRHALIQAGRHIRVVRHN